MDCKEAESLVIPYIEGKLTEQELASFLNHISGCKNCREELEIYYTVDVGIRQLDDDTGSYNIKGALESTIAESRQKLYGIQLRRIIRYSVNTLSVLMLIVTLLLQCRIWWQNGFYLK